MLHRVQGPIEILEGEVLADIPASLKPRPGEVLIPFSDWLKTRH